MASHANRANPEIGKDGFCNARVGRGRCKRIAGANTDHLGLGACSRHGGGTPSANLAAARAMAAKVMGTPVDVSPHEALLYCVQITAAAVIYCNDMIGELVTALATPTIVTDREWSGGEEGGGFSTQVVTRDKEMNIWIRVRDEYVDRLAKFAKMAIDAGVEERLVRIAEKTAEFMRPVLQAIFDELELTAEQRERAPDILRRHLLPLEEPVLPGKALPAAQPVRGEVI